MKNRLGDANALPISFGERFDRLALHRLQVAFDDDVAQAFVDFVFRSKTARLRNVREEFDNSHFWIRGTAFGQVADSAFSLERMLADIETIDRSGSRCRRQKAGYHLHRGGLAGPVRTEEAEYIAFLDLKGYTVYSSQVTIVFN